MKYSYYTTDPIQFHLDCAKNHTIQVESVFWLLPTKAHHYCLDADSKQCSRLSPCDCCTMPSNPCGLESKSHGRKSCNGMQHCTLTMEDQYVNICPGREYDCDREICNSRWARVLYRCQPMQMKTGKTVVFIPSMQCLKSKYFKTLLVYISTKKNRSEKKFK